jgi:hypothetical protein
MYETTRQLYARFSNVKTVYYRFDPTVEQDQLDSDILRIRGHETFVPGILQKTIRAFEYFQRDLDQYDYVVRSNISTIINFDALTDILRPDTMQHPIEYGSTNVFTLLCTDPKAGIHDTILLGTTVASGTNIILSTAIVDSILQNQDKIDYTIIDDVAIGVFMKNHKPDIKIRHIYPGSFVHVPNFNGNYEEVVKFYNQHSNAIVFRNRNDPDRMVDSQQMKILCELLNSSLSK